MNDPNYSDSQPSASQYLSTVQVAKAVGVSVTTIKRWVDDGILPAHRTAGGHRKLMLADVQRLAREGGLPQADPSQLLLSDPRRPANVEQFFTQLLDVVKRIDVDGIRAVLRAAFQSGLGVEVMADRLICPAMAYVGRQWEHGRTDVSAEHLITQAVVAAMYELRQQLLTNAPKDRPVAIGGAPEHDHYVLPSLLSKLTLLEAGWNAVNIGPHTPASAFVSAIESLKPELIWISVSHIENEQHFESEFHVVHQAAQSQNIPLAIGGQALTAELRARLPYTTYGDGLSQLAAFARSLNPPARRPKRGRPPVNKG